MEGFTIWFTGLPRAGKTTVATLVARELKDQGYKVEILDGDVVRTNLSKGLGFSKEDRDTNIRRIGFVCRLLSRNGVVAIAAAISPYRAIRDEVRQSIGRFVEVYVKCPVEVCEQRDFKELYEKARRGEIENFTGVSDPYEEPLHPEVVCDTDKESPEESAAKVLQKLMGLQYLPQTIFTGGERQASLVYLPEEEEEIKARLRSLGYLE
jgi:adenylylsulfate kinase